MTLHLKNHESGVSLIEVMIVAALLGLIAVITSEHLSNAERTAKDLHEKLKARHVLDRSIAEIITSGGYFPPQVTGGKAASYIACYNMQGLMTANSRGDIGFVVKRLDDINQPSGLCPDAKFELYITPATDGSNNADLSVIVFNKQGAKEKKLEYRSRITMESAL